MNRARRTRIAPMLCGPGRDTRTISAPLVTRGTTSFGDVVGNNDKRRCFNLLIFFVVSCVVCVGQASSGKEKGGVAVADRNRPQAYCVALTFFSDLRPAALTRFHDSAETCVISIFSFFFLSAVAIVSSRKHDYGNPNVRVFQADGR